MILTRDFDPLADLDLAVPESDPDPDLDLDLLTDFELVLDSSLRNKKNRSYFTLQVPGVGV